MKSWYKENHNTEIQKKNLVIKWIMKIIGYEDKQTAKQA